MSQSNIDGQRVSIRATARTRGPRCTYLLADVAFWQIVLQKSPRRGVETRLVGWIEFSGMTSLSAISRKLR